METKQMQLINLGWPIGKLDPKKHLLTIVSPCDADPSYVPSQCVTIFSREHLVALRDALVLAYPLSSEKESPMPVVVCAAKPDGNTAHEP